MHSWRRIFFAAATFCAVAGAFALPAEAMGRWNSSWVHHHEGNGGGPGGGPGGGKGSSVGAPGPIAGAGLPFLLLAGGYALIRRYRSRRNPE